MRSGKHDSGGYACAAMSRGVSRARLPMPLVVLGAPEPTAALLRRIHRRLSAPPTTAALVHSSAGAGAALGATFWTVFGHQYLLRARFRRKRRTAGSVVQVRAILERQRGTTRKICRQPRQTAREERVKIRRHRLPALSAHSVAEAALPRRSPRCRWPLRLDMRRLLQDSAPTRRTASPRARAGITQ